MIEIQVQSLLFFGKFKTISISPSATVAQVKQQLSNLEGVSSSLINLKFDGVVLDNSDKLDDLGIIEGSKILSSNTVARLSSRSDRQNEKLELSRAKRIVLNKPRRFLDVRLLPTVYSGNTVVDNPNIGGLIKGRPWVDIPLEPGGNTLLEDGSGKLLLEDGENSLTLE